MKQLDRRIRYILYNEFAATGRPPSFQVVAERAPCSLDDVGPALSRLESHHALVLAPTSGHIWMVHPFSAVATPFRLEARDGRSYYGNCAWDLMAIPPLLNLDAISVARCAESGGAVELVFERGELVAGDGVVHLAVPPRHFWDNVGHT